MSVTRRLFQITLFCYTYDFWKFSVPRHLISAVIKLCTFLANNNTYYVPEADNYYYMVS